MIRVISCIRCFLWGAFCYFFFFFKQKTAYEMRISDWSSDVCSSDLRLCGNHADRLADVDDMATGQVTAVAQATHAERRFATDRRAHLDRLHAGIFHSLHPGLVEQRIAGNERVLVVAGQEHVLGHDTDRPSKRLNSSHSCATRMPSSALTKKHETQI